MKDTIITGLDLGSISIRLVVGQLFSDGPERKLQLLGAVEHPSQGITRGSITSIDDAASAISVCLEKAERITGIPIDTAWVGISGTTIMSQSSRGIVAVGKINGEISKQDLERALEAARAIATPPNYEILHVIPRGAIIDGQIQIKDPIGMTGTRLEVDTLIIQAFTSEIRNYTKCIYRTGLEIEDLVFSALATAEGVLTARQKELGAVLINIGKSITTLVVYENGELLHTTVLPVGSDHITQDIAIGLKVSPDTAEKIKLDYGSIFVRDADKKLEIDLSAIDAEEEGRVTVKYVSQIIEARVEEIFEKVQEELKKIGKAGILPAGCILTGGGSKLGGMPEMAKKCLKLPASYASVKNIVNPMEKVFDQSYTTAIGLAFWGLSFYQHRAKGPGFLSNLDDSLDIKGRVNKWFKSLLP
ncbi:cell division protein FtsA [Candidatus Uhrbacteria bacterium]|nr:cell division protein FtsA [Candidatus Uhrbacteria bacterium]